MQELVKSEKKQLSSSKAASVSQQSEDPRESTRINTEFRKIIAQAGTPCDGDAHSAPAMAIKVFESMPMSDRAKFLGAAKVIAASNSGKESMQTVMMLMLDPSKIDGIITFNDQFRKENWSTGTVSAAVQKINMYIKADQNIIKAIYSNAERAVPSDIDHAQDFKTRQVKLCEKAFHSMLKSGRITVQRAANGLVPDLN